MSQPLKKFEYSIERFIYNDDYVNSDLEILNIKSEIIESKNEPKEEEIVTKPKIDNEEEQPAERSDR